MPPLYTIGDEPHHECNAIISLVSSRTSNVDDPELLATYQGQPSTSSSPSPPS
jgi:hypothetical protein